VRRRIRLWNDESGVLVTSLGGDDCLRGINTRTTSYVLMHTTHDFNVFTSDVCLLQVFSAIFDSVFRRREGI